MCLISILLPVYNEKREYLKKAVESTLNQTFQNFELLILDDCSNRKETLNYLHELESQNRGFGRDFEGRGKRVSVIRNKINLGLARNLNKGLKIAQGKYIARLDSDDFCRKNRLEVQLNFMKKNSNCVLCASWAKIINENGEIIGKKKSPTSYKEIKKNIISYNFFTHSSWFFKKEPILKLRGYPQDANLNEDYALLLRLIPSYQVEIIPQYLVFFRMNFKSLSLKNNKRQEWLSLKSRLGALQKYDYPKTYYLKLIRSILIFLFIPTFLKLKVIRYINGR